MIILIKQTGEQDSYRAFASSVVAAALRAAGASNMLHYIAACLLLTGCATIPASYLPNPANRSDDPFQSTTNKTSATVFPFDESSTFEAYLSYAFAHNAGLKAAEQKWIQVQEMIPQARTLDDPSLSFEYFIEQIDTRYSAGIEQSFPPLGTLSLREKYADAEAEAAYHRYENERFMVYDRVAQAVFNYYYLGRTITILEEQLQLLKDQEAVANRSYAAAKTPYSFLLNIQMERARIENELATKKEERIAQSSNLSSLLNLPNQRLIPWPNMIPSESTLLDYEIFETMLAELNPELKTAQAEMDAAYYQEKLARKKFLPNFLLGAKAMVMPNNDMDFGVMAGITLPIWRSSYHAKIRETAAVAKAAENEKTDLGNELKTELRMAIFKTQEAKRRIKLYQEELIPKAEQSLNVANQEFATGQIDFMKLIDAQRMLLEFKLMNERAVADREIALAEIGCCIGKFTHAKSKE